MITNLRIFCIQAITDYAKLLQPDNRGWKVMEVGIAGDEKPGGNYKLFGNGNDYQTLDVIAKYEPDILADICDTKLDGDNWDVIILSNTLEHVFNYQKALKECFRLLKKGGVLIFDIPFMYPYHPDPDFEDYWRLSPSAFRDVLNLIGFDVEVCQLVGGILTTGLARKPSYV
jgi:SAM-dependent methyltransferase